MKVLLTHPIQWVREFTKILLENEHSFTLDTFNEQQVWITGKYMSLYIVSGEKTKFIRFTEKMTKRSAICEEFKLETPPKYIFYLYKIKEKLLSYKYEDHRHRPSGRTGLPAIEGWLY